MTKPKVKIYTDGACANNPGKGGYGIVLMYKKENGDVVQKNLSKGFEMTTNNRMELLAVIDALNSLKAPCEIELYSDSKYVVDSVTKGWAKSWQKNGWVKSDKKPQARLIKVKKDGSKNEA